jgi:hypothetical protein
VSAKLIYNGFLYLCELVFVIGETIRIVAMSKRSSH